MASATLYHLNPFLHSHSSSSAPKSQVHISKTQKSSTCELSSSSLPRTPNTQINPTVQTKFLSAINQLPPNLRSDDLLNALNNEQNNTVALRIFKWATKRYGFTVDPSVYEFMISRMGSAMRFDNMQDVFRQMSHPTEGAALKMLWSYASKHMVNETLQVFQEIKVTGFKPTTECYNLLLNFLVHHNLGLVESMYSQMMSDEVKPNVKTFNILIKGFCKVNQIGSALDLLKLMSSEYGLVPSVVTYTTLMHGLIKRGRMEEALELLKKMDSSGCIPSDVTYNILLHGFCKQGRVEEATRFLEGICGTGFCPNTFTFNTIIDGFCKAGDTDRATDLLEKMVEEGFKPDVVTYNTLISGVTLGAASKEGRVKNAIELFIELISKGHKPDVYTSSIMLHGLFKGGNLDTAMKLIDEMLSRGCTPDSVTYSVLMKRLRKAGRLERAMQLQREMETRASLPFPLVIPETGRC